MQKVEPQAYSVSGAAKLLSVSRMTVYRLVKKGKLRAVRIGSDLRIPASVLEELLKEGTPNAA